MRPVLIFIAAAALTFPPVGITHHSFSAEFDVGRPVELTGTIVRLEWTNPHAWIHLDVVDDEGNTQKWAVELLSINTLARAGLTPKTIKVGDLLTVKGYGARNGTNAANASSVIRTETGETLWASARERGNSAD